MDNEETTRSARIVRHYNHGTNVQLLCSDERGLLSIYLEPKTFMSFYKKICKSGMQMAGLLISFDHKLVGVPALGNHRNTFPLQAR